MDEFPVVMAKLPYGPSNSVIMGQFVFGLRIIRNGGFRQPPLPAQYVQYVMEEYSIENNN
jgi:hypothetical protein